MRFVARPQLTSLTCHSGPLKKGTFVHLTRIPPLTGVCSVQEMRGLGESTRDDVPCDSLCDQNVGKWSNIPFRGPRFAVHRTRDIGTGGPTKRYLPFDYSSDHCSCMYGEGQYKVWCPVPILSYPMSDVWVGPWVRRSIVMEINDLLRNRHGLRFPTSRKAIIHSHGQGSWGRREYRNLVWQCQFCTSSIDGCGFFWARVALLKRFERLCRRTNRVIVFHSRPSHISDLICIPGERVFLTGWARPPVKGRC